MHLINTVKAIWHYKVGNYTFIYYPGQETAKVTFRLRAKQPKGHMSTIHGGGFTLFLLLLNVKQRNCKHRPFKS